MPVYSDVKENMKKLIQKYHAAQRRNNNPALPYTEHLYGVASVIKTSALRYNEISEPDLDNMIAAALGHDLLEDTGIDEAVLEG